MFIIFPAVLFWQSYTPDSGRARFRSFMADINAFSIAKRILIHSQIDERTILGNSLFFYVFVILFHKKERFSYGHRFKRRIEKT